MQHLQLDNALATKVCFIPCRDLLSSLKYQPRQPYNLEVTSLEDMLRQALIDKELMHKVDYSKVAIACDLTLEGLMTVLKAILSQVEQA